MELEAPGWKVIWDDSRDSRMFLARSLIMKHYFLLYLGLTEVWYFILIVPLKDWLGSAFLTFFPQLSLMTEEGKLQVFVGEGNSTALNSLLQVEQ